MFFPELRVQV